ncbi:uncharacterized protein LOC133285208 [Gastrolobium bilobum]|uniref:uncharacterized protein LOC133285208 n=1 Tax=Gastrolobium bilobum TaxID=150636 RepID=UPI002AAF9F32|nr:uncharacterized protein LOC133285208 [Gastrolobium bilobum]
MAYDNNVDLCTHLSLARCPCNTMVCTHLSLGKCHCNTTNEDVFVSLTKKRKMSEETSVAARKKVCGERSWGSLPKDLAENLVVPVLDGDVEKGVQVEIWDMDTASIHSLVFKKWVSSRSYVFIGNWVKYFVSRRGLKKGDEISLHWDSYNNRFDFSVLDAI